MPSAKRGGYGDSTKRGETPKRIAKTDHMLTRSISFLSYSENVTKVKYRTRKKKERKMLIEREGSICFSLFRFLKSDFSSQMRWKDFTRKGS